MDVFNLLEAIGIIGIVYIILAAAVSTLKFSEVRGSLLKKSALFFLFAVLSMLVIATSSMDRNFYVLFVLTEFLFSLTLFYNYLKSNLVILAFSGLFLYMEDVMIILSIYFSFYITGSIIQSITSEKKGSIMVLSSFMIMDVSLVLQTFYILKMFTPFMTAGIILFFLAVVIFIAPFFRGGKD